MLTGTLFSLLKCSGGFLEAHSMKELIEIVSNLLIEAIQLGSFVVLEFGVRPIRLKEAGSQRRVNAFE